MDVDAAVKGGIDGCGGRAVFDTGQPARIAVGQHVDGAAVFVAANLLDQRQSVLSYFAAVFHLQLDNVAGAAAGTGDFFGEPGGQCFGQDPVHSPCEIDGCWPGGLETIGFADHIVVADSIVGGIQRCQKDSVSPGCSNQGRPPNVHVLDGRDDIVNGF